MEDEQKLTEQQRTALSQLEDLRSELHSMVDARVDGSIHSILTGRVLEQALPTLPLTANPSVFKGEKPESILFPDGREVKTPTWKTAVLAIMRDCNADAKMHLQLMELRGKVLGRQPIDRLVENQIVRLRGDGKPECRLLLHALGKPAQGLLDVERKNIAQRVEARIGKIGI